MAKKFTQHLLRCGKCKEGEIAVSVKLEQEFTTVDIKKCSNKKCRHQYYIKQLTNNPLEKITNEIHNDDLEDLDDEFEGYDHCVKCGRDYDEVDREYQSCKKCGWDEAQKKWADRQEPTDDDFLNGDADLLTGQWR